MKVLMLGGTRYFGVHMVECLLDMGHAVTIATRGLTQDAYGQNVERIVVERTSRDNLRDVLAGRQFDVVCDNLAYCSNDVKHLLDAVDTGRYVMTSSMSAYKDWHMDIREDELDPLSQELIWCAREDFTYDELKRQAECALFKQYGHIPSVAVRYPYVIGEDDYTKRLHFYIEHVMKHIPMSIDNLDARLCFVNSREAGAFLAWLTEQRCTGVFNAASNGTISLREILDYVGQKTGNTPVLSEDGEEGPYNGTSDFSANTDKAAASGFVFSRLEDWIYTLLDALMLVCKG